MKTIYLNNELINIGDWEYKIVNGIVTNPLPVDAEERDEEVMTDAEGGKYVVTK
jgi:hypothetical protein